MLKEKQSIKAKLHFFLEQIEQQEKKKQLEEQEKLEMEETDEKRGGKNK